MISEGVLKQIIEAVSNSNGYDFFDKMTENLAKIVGADFCFIARVNKELTTSHTLSIFSPKHKVDNFEYNLKNTPCAEVVQGHISIYPENVIKTFPKDKLLVDMKIEGYIGANLKNIEGNVIGIVVALFNEKITQPDDIHILYQVFTGRISAEIDRHETKKKFKTLNKSLERLIDSSTGRLINQEKLASVGVLLDGISHEINTPLARSITANSVITESIDSILLALKNKKLSQEFLTKNLNVVSHASDLVQTNLDLSANLIDNFKQIALDKMKIEKSKFNLKTTIETLLISLQSIISNLSIVVITDIEDKIIIESYLGDYHQVFSHLLLNSIHHAFENKGERLITIKAKLNNSEIKMTIEDNGVGIKKEHINHIFDPFFTTSRANGHTGLGLNTVLNTITQKLEGKIIVESEVNIGTKFHIRLPVKTR
jgi:signal transduction histidine kinase